MTEEELKNLWDAPIAIIWRNRESKNLYTRMDSPIIRQKRTDNEKCSDTLLRAAGRFIYKGWKIWAGDSVAVVRQRPTWTLPERIMW
jgi:hypothetical protein